MLVQFSVGNFLSFKEINTFSLVASSLKDKKVRNEDVMFTPFEESKVNLLRSAVLYGANASGKSNFISALEFFKWFIINSSKGTQVQESIGIGKFRLSTEKDDKPSFFEIIFLWKGNQYRYGFEADSKKIFSEWLFQKKTKIKSKEIELFFRDGIGKTSTHDKFTIGTDLIEKNMVRGNALLLSVAAQFNDRIASEVLQWLQYVNILSGLFEDEYRAFTISLLQNPDYRERVIAFTKYADLGIDDIQMVDGEINDVGPRNNSPEVAALSRKSLIGAKVSTLMSFHPKYDEQLTEVDSVHFYFTQSESHGTIKYFSLAGPIIDALDNGKAFVIDELDSKLHPLLTQKIISLFNSPITNSKNAQLIFTSHDTNLLSANIFRRDQIWFTQKNRYGATELYSLSEYKVRNDALFENDYLQGKYGAVPVLKDFKKIFKPQNQSTDGE